MSKGKFLFGFVFGTAAGFAAKYLYDNKEEVKKVAAEKCVQFKEDIDDFVQYASQKAQDIKESVASCADDYAEFAEKQYEEIKEAVADSFQDNSEAEAQGQN